jgi:hypothetical protein
MEYSTRRRSCCHPELENFPPNAFGTTTMDDTQQGEPSQVPSLAYVNRVCVLRLAYYAVILHALGCLHTRVHTSLTDSSIKFKMKMVK